MSSNHYFYKQRSYYIFSSLATSLDTFTVAGTNVHAEISLNNALIELLLFRSAQDLLHEFVAPPLCLKGSRVLAVPEKHPETPSALFSVETLSARGGPAGHTV